MKSQVVSILMFLVDFLNTYIHTYLLDASLTKQRHFLTFFVNHFKIKTVYFVCLPQSEFLFFIFFILGHSVYHFSQMKKMS